MASRRRLGSMEREWRGRSWERTLFHLWGRDIPSYRENSSKYKPAIGRSRPGWGHPPWLKSSANFSTLRGGKGATEAGAFQRCSGGGGPQRARDVLILGDRERKGAMEYVAGAQRIHGMHRKGRRLPAGSDVSWSQIGAQRAAGCRHERTGVSFAIFFKRLNAVVGDRRRSPATASLGKYQMRRHGEQAPPAATSR